MRIFNFHNNFALNRERLSAMLRCVVEDPTTSKETIAAAMGVNPYAVEGYRGWLGKTGLGTFENKTYTISAFGTYVARYDPYLEHPGTLWGLHYHLAASQNDERAEVWYHFFNHFATPGKSFTKAEVLTYMERSLAALTTGKNYISNDIKELFKCYERLEILGSLGILRSNPATKSYTMAPDGVLPDVTIIAYMLFDSWQRLYPSYDTLRLSQLCEEPEMIGRICVAGRAQIQQAVGILQSMGHLAFADTQHEPVTRRFQDDPLSFLEHYYQSL